MNKISPNDSIDFKRIKSCNNADIVVTSEKGNNEESLSVITYTSHNDDMMESIYHAEIILYENTDFHRTGYDYEDRYDDNDPSDNPSGVIRDGSVDGDFYRGYFNVMKHEIGDALGLDPVPDNSNYLMYNTQDFDRTYTVSKCKLAAIIKKNFIDRELDETICEPS